MRAQQQQPRLVEPGPRQGQSLLEPARKAAGQAAGTIGELHLGQNFGDAFLLGLHAIEAGVEGEILLNGQLVIEKGFMADEADAAANGVVESAGQRG
jgi:hypothetical protein